MPLVAGIDSSTQACLIVLRDAEDGRIVASAEAPHPPASPPASEQWPEDWWSALCAASAQLDLRDVVAVSIDGQGHGLVVLDASGDAVRPAKLWNDTTASGEAGELVDMLGAETWARRSGIVPTSAITVAKLLWLCRHEPKAYARAARVLLPPGYLTYRLCGAFVSDRSEGSGSGFMEAAATSWDLGLLALVDPERDWPAVLPNLAGPSEAVGTVTSEAARATGFPPGIVVGPGANDQPVSALALGLTGDEAVISLGTSGTVSVRSRGPLVDATGAVQSVADAAGAFRPLVCTQNATRVTDTFAALLGVDHDGLAGLALTATGTEHRPILLPYLEGERTPDRPTATGTLAGLRTDSTPEELARASFEGVLCGLLDGLDRLYELGVPSGGRLVLTGGGARSVAYRQLAADLAGRPVYVGELEETSASGVAVQAAAIVHGTSVDAVALEWAPAIREVASPRSGQGAATIRSRHRRLRDLTVPLESENPTA